MLWLTLYMVNQGRIDDFMPFAIRFCDVDLDK